MAQYILLLLSITLFGCGIFFFATKRNAAGVIVFIGATTLSLVGGVGPESIVQLTFNKNGASFVRNPDTIEDINKSINLSDLLGQCKVSIEKINVSVEKNTPDGKRSGSDYLILSTGSYQESDFIQSVTYAQQGLNIESKNKELTSALFYSLARSLEGLNVSDKALSYYLKSIEIDNDYAPSHSSIGSILFDLNRFEEAETSAKKAHEINPDSACYTHNLGYVIETIGRLNESEKYYREAIKIDPDFAKSYYGLGNVLGKMNKEAEAEASFRKAIELDPSHFYYNNLYVLLLKQDRLIDAEKLMRAALNYVPNNTNNSDVYTKLADVLSKLENYPESEKYYLKALDVSPSSSFINNNYGYFLSKNNRYAEAEKHYKKSISIDPEDEQAMLNISDLLFKMGRKNEAYQYLQKLIKINQRYNKIANTLIDKYNYMPHNK